MHGFLPLCIFGSLEVISWLSMLSNGGEIIFVRFIKIYIRDKIRNRMYRGIVLIGIGQVWSMEGGSLVA